MRQKMRRPPPGLRSQCEGLTTEEEEASRWIRRTLARPRTPSPVSAGKKHPQRRTARPPGSLVHDNTRHTTRFTVIGNHLAQHPELSLLAIGLGRTPPVAPHRRPRRHQDPHRPLPRGLRPVSPPPCASSKPTATSAAPANAVPGGRIVTRTVSCNQPGRRTGHEVASEHARSVPEPAPPAHPAPGIQRRLHPASRSPPYPHPVLFLPHPPPNRHRPPRRTSVATTPASSSPPRDVRPPRPRRRRLVERDLSPTAVRACPHQRTSRPKAPAPSSRPPGPPPRRAAPTSAAVPQPPRRHPDVRQPFQTCHGCDRAFRSPAPGHCRDCRSDLTEAAQHGPSPFSPGPSRTRSRDPASRPG